MTEIAVIGSGMAAAGASYRLRQEHVTHVLFDQHGHLGGHTTSHTDSQGFVFDEGPHISFTKSPRIQDLFAESVEGRYEVIHARVNNYWKGQWIKHPAQCNLHGLPVDLLVDVLSDMIEAGQKEAHPANYEEWLVASFGRRFAEMFPMQYGRKFHTTEAANMSLDWLGPRLYRPSLKEILRGALTADTADVHYITEFRYPTHGGFLAYLRPLLANADVRLNHRVAAIDPAARVLSFAHGLSEHYEHLISSIPLPDLIPMIAGVPDPVRRAAGRLAATIVVLVNVGLNRADISDAHWTYFYDDEFCFSRLSYPHMLSKFNAPEGAGSIQAEVYFSEKYKPLDRTPETLISEVIDGLRRCGLIRPTDRVLTQSAQVVRYANVIFDLERKDALKTVHKYLDDVGIRYCGRYGEWGYQWTDEAFVSGEQAAERVLSAMAAPSPATGTT